MKRFRTSPVFGIFVLACVFLVASCETDGSGGDGCLGDTDALIVGCTGGCGTGMTPIGQGCLGSCIFGGDGGGCGSCAGEGCDMGCDSCGSCGDAEPYAYDGDVVEGAVQVAVTDSLFTFLQNQLMDLVEVAAGDVLDADAYCQRCASGEEDWDCDECEQWFSYCLEPVSADAGIFTVEVCNRGRNCVAASGADGCWVHAKLGEPQFSSQLVSENHVRANIYVPIEDVNAPLPSSVGGNCTIHLGKWKEKEFSVSVGADLIRNPDDKNTELYVGGDQVHLVRDGLNIDTDCFLINLAEAFGIVNSVIDGIVDGIGAISCRGCDTIADCGAGATSCTNGTCRDNSGHSCQGIQIGADAKIDGGSLLQSIDPGAESVLGLEAFLGSYATAKLDGLQLGARMGGKADPDSLCVPLRPSPIHPGTASCTTGDSCPPLEELNTQNTILNPSTGDMDPFHLGIGVAEGGLNQVLWSAYSSGLLCLSIGGETEGLDILGTKLFGAFVNSLSALTYGKNQPLMIQLRPQYPPTVSFEPDEEQGAIVNVSLPDLKLDFYTIVDDRYMRIFTLSADLALPLSIQASGSTLNIALGDLTQAIDPDTLEIENVEMVSPSQVDTLVRNLPSLIGSLTGLLGDQLIPPIEIPAFSGIKLELVGPGVTVLNENGEPAALGIFAKLGLDVGQIGDDLNPEIQSLNVDIQPPSELHALIAARRAAGQSFSYRDLMPHVTAQMGLKGGVSSADVQYAYSINHGPWSFWRSGPTLTFDNPILATEGRFNVRVIARERGDASTGTAKPASFSFVNDYTAPNATLRAAGERVAVIATDNVYAPEDLTMRVRINDGAWSEPLPVGAIALDEAIADGRRAIVDVLVSDPSGNARSVRRTFGASADDAAPAGAATDGSGAQNTAGGCSSGGGVGGWLTLFALFALIGIRRRKRAVGIAASSPYVGLCILVMLAAMALGTGCKNNGAGLSEATCTSDADCASPEMCLDGVCAMPQRCTYSDDCPHGYYCSADNYCIPSECSTSSECDASACGDGEYPLCDYDDYEQVEAGECICSAGVMMGNYGGWLQTMRLANDDVVALAYHEGFGDLIFGTLQSDGMFDWSFIDGVPDGPVVLPPSGRRGGIKAKGEDAGRYVSAVHEVTDGTDRIHAVYQVQARKGGDAKLRYARGERGQDGWTWTYIDLDDRNATGLFPSIVLTATPAAPVPPPSTDNGDENTSTDNGDETTSEDDGETPEAEAAEGLAIVYMTGDISMDTGDGSPVQYYAEISALYSATRTPTSADDFVLQEGIDQAASAVACGGLCAEGSRCLTADNRCVPAATGCAECDEDSGEQCVSIDETPQCAAASTPAEAAFETLPAGVGLFSSAAVGDDGVVHIAYYDQVSGVLKYLALEVSDDTLSPLDAPLVVDGQDANGSTGDVGRWTDIHLLDDGRIVIFYEDAGRAELRAAVISNGVVDITVLDDGSYINGDRSEVRDDRVGTSIDAIPREDGGFDVYYQDATDAVVRHIGWTDLEKAPSGHPYAVFGSERGLDRDLMTYETAVARPELAIGADGAYGLFTQVLAFDDYVLLASKHIYADGSAVRMDVRTAIPGQNGSSEPGGNGNDGGNDGNDGDNGGNTTPIACATPGKFSAVNGTTNYCRQCVDDGKTSVWEEQAAPSNFYRCIAHHDSSAYDNGCDAWGFFSGSSCASTGGADFNLDDYSTNHLCTRSAYENDDAKTRNVQNTDYWEHVSDPDSLITPNWPEGFAEMAHVNNRPNDYINAKEVRDWIFARKFRYLGQLNGEPGPNDADGMTYYPGWKASALYLEPGETQWLAFYYNDRRDWQDRIGVLAQFDDSAMDIEMEISFVCGRDGGGGRPRLDGFRDCGAEGNGTHGDMREAFGVRCGAEGDLDLAQRDGGGGDARTRYSSCVADTWAPHDDLPWSSSDGNFGPGIDASWAQQGGVYLEGHIDCGQAPGNNSGGRDGWTIVRVTRRADTGKTDAGTCTPVTIRPTWFHHNRRADSYEECWSP